MAKANRAPTAYDVARLAGVSQATVSYVLNGRRGGKTRINETTRQRILDAVAELGYVPNDTARSLRRRRTDRICLLLPRLGSPFADVIAQDLQRVAAGRGYSTVFAVGGSPEREELVLDQLRRGLADGLLDVVGLDGGILTPLVETGIAVVSFSNRTEPAGFDVVRSTVAEVSYHAVADLFERGHQRVALISHQPDAVVRDERHDSYLRALRDRGIAPDERLIRGGAASRQDAFHSTVGLLQLDDPPTAIFAESDVGAISAIWAIHDAGLRIPEDVAVIGVGNTPEGEITRPALTSIGPISMDFSDVAELLMSRLAGEAPAAGRLHHRPWSLICRGSA